MPRTFTLPVKVEKCPCGSPHCNDYHLSVGSFVQGSGFSKEQALEIASALNASEKMKGCAVTTMTETEQHNFGQRLLALTPGGSEYFKRAKEAGLFAIDVEAVVSYLERHHHYRVQMMRTLHPSRELAKAARGVRAVARSPSPFHRDALALAEAMLKVLGEE